MKPTWGVSRIRGKKTDPHLIAGDGIPESFDEFYHLPRIPLLIYEESCLVYEPRCLGLVQQRLGSLPDLFQRAAGGVDKCGEANNR